MDTCRICGVMTTSGSVCGSCAAEYGPGDGEDGLADRVEALERRMRELEVCWNNWRDLTNERIEARLEQKIDNLEQLLHEVMEELNGYRMREREREIVQEEPGG